MRSIASQIAEGAALQGIDSPVAKHDRMEIDAADNLRPIARILTPKAANFPKRSFAPMRKRPAGVGVALFSSPSPDGFVLPVVQRNLRTTFEYLP